MSYAEIRFLITGYGRNRPNSRQRAINFKRLVARDGTCCWICGTEIDFSLPREHEEAWSLDHYIPFSHGGSNHIDNLRLAHKICNEKRANPNIEETQMPATTKTQWYRVPIAKNGRSYWITVPASDPRSRQPGAIKV